MNRETYNYIWQEIIRFQIDKLCETKPENVNCVCSNPIKRKLIKERIFTKYTAEKERLKALYHHGAGEEPLIDIHKIAACFTKVLISENIFEMSFEDEISDDAFLLNASLAYMVGLNLLRMSLVFVYVSKGNEDITKTLLQSDTLQVPVTNEGHDEYNLGRKKTLALNYIYDNEFDILTYSDMMFWIEYYNRQILEKNIFPSLIEEKNRVCDIILND